MSKTRIFPFPIIVELLSRNNDRIKKCFLVVPKTDELLSRITKTNIVLTLHRILVYIELCNLKYYFNLNIEILYFRYTHC